MKKTTKNLVAGKIKVEEGFCNEAKSMKVISVNNQTIDVKSVDKTIDEKNIPTTIIELYDSEETLVEVKVRGNQVYQNIDERVLKYPKKVWSYINHIIKENKLYKGDNFKHTKENLLYYHAGKEILLTFDDEENICATVDFLDIEQLKEYETDNLKEGYVINEDFFNKVIKYRQLIFDICDENGWGFYKSHDSGCFVGDIYSKIYIPFFSKFDEDAFNYVLRLAAKTYEMYNKDCPTIQDKQ